MNKMRDGEIFNPDDKNPDHRVDEGGKRSEVASETPNLPKILMVDDREIVLIPTCNRNNTGVEWKYEKILQNKNTA